ncbi:hypothetical protein FHW58_003436 [Duganella sp. 1224]|uniref:hypothetical protein n=1 Tax=Duganella sp. 1224 TaxID=2587052 RepID=UPI0015C6D2F0|nr:hypothetical protein [Duganella sp. 1224]NYE62221.1 hypothetical protein [Duganella sp. 1224]
MNDLKIMEYIAATKDVRAVQIADKFDVELVDASAALRSLVDVGDLVRTQGTAPNGQSAQIYNLSPEYCKTSEGKALMQRVAPAAPIAQQAPSGQDQLPTALVDQLSKVGLEAQGLRPVGSRLDRALAYLRANGKATNDQLRDVMGMRSFEYPSTALRAAVNDGRVARDGDDWIVGTGQPATKQRRASSPAPRPAAGADRPAEAARAAAPEAPVAPAAAGLRCAVWSDGVIELQRDAKTICTMSRDEALFIAAYIKSTGAEHA